MIFIEPPKVLPSTNLLCRYFERDYKLSQLLESVCITGACCENCTAPLLRIRSWYIRVKVLVTFTNKEFSKSSLRSICLSRPIASIVPSFQCRSGYTANSTTDNEEAHPPLFHTTFTFTLIFR